MHLNDLCLTQSPSNEPTHTHTLKLVLEISPVRALKIAPSNCGWFPPFLIFISLNWFRPMSPRISVSHNNSANSAMFRHRDRLKFEKTKTKITKNQKMQREEIKSHEKKERRENWDHSLALNCAVWPASKVKTNWWMNRSHASRGPPFLCIGVVFQFTGCSSVGERIFLSVIEPTLLLESYFSWFTHQQLSVCFWNHTFISLNLSLACRIKRFFIRRVFEPKHDCLWQSTQTRNETMKSRRCSATAGRSWLNFSPNIGVIASIVWSFLPRRRWQHRKLFMSFEFP